jgi:hypothetical protein
VKHTIVNLEISAGTQMPSDNPSGERVASQPKSDKISAPWMVEEIRPKTKKHVLRRV